MGKEKKPSFGVFFWIVLLCFIAVLYIGSRIQFPQWIAQRFGGDYRYGTSLPLNPSPEKNPQIEKPTPNPDTRSAHPEESPPPPQQKPEVSPVPEKPASSSAIPSSATAESEEGDTAQSLPPPVRSRISKLYFLRISESGKPELIPMERKITYRNAPLTETLKELLKGPTPQEREKGISTLIPQGTEIKKVYIRDGIAYIDLGESFRFNPFGAEGYQTQVRQIVYTVTEFPGIHGVQFLVEGRKLDYLSPEGVYIGKPLLRDSFPSSTR